MQGTQTTGDSKEQKMKVQAIDVTAQTFSALEIKNQKFKRIAWAAAFLLLGVLTILVLQLAEIIEY
jgi:uncharacterized membrane protein SpoIIM required for sporulation